MLTPEKEIIRRFAGGATELRDAAIAIYRKYLLTLGGGGNVFMEFMGEVDCKVPDLVLRGRYRQRILAGEEAPLHGKRNPRLTILKNA